MTLDGMQPEDVNRIFNAQMTDTSTAITVSRDTSSRIAQLCRRGDSPNGDYDTTRPSIQRTDRIDGWSTNRSQTGVYESDIPFGDSFPCLPK